MRSEKLGEQGASASKALSVPMLSQVTESALAAIEATLILKTKVYRSLNMGVLQGGRATPGEFGRDLNPPWVVKLAKNLELISFFALWHPSGS